MQKPMIIPAPYKGVNYQIHITHVIRPTIGYHVSVYRGGKNVLSMQESVGTIDKAKKEGARMVVLHYNQKSAIDAQTEINAAKKTASPYAVGTIKLTWTDKLNNRIIHHKMFEKLDEALKETGDKKNWLVWKLNKGGQDEYDWQLLPNGSSGLYLRRKWLDDHMVVKLLGYGFMLAGIYFVGNLIYKKVKGMNSPSMLPPSPDMNMSMTPPPVPPVVSPSPTI